MGKPSSDAQSRRRRRDNNAISGANLRRYKGVRMRKWGKWVAEVRLPNSRARVWLGSYETQEMAARAYDAAVFCIRGTSANFNFPGTPPRIPSCGNMTPSQIQAAASRYAYEAGPRSAVARNREESVVGNSSSMELIPMELNLNGEEAMTTSSTFLGESRDHVPSSSLDGFPEECYIPAATAAAPAASAGGGERLEDVIHHNGEGTFYQSLHFWTF